MMHTAAQIESLMSEELACLARDLASLSNGVETTVLCIPRHGHGTTAAMVEQFYRNSPEPFVFIYLDIASPPAIAAQLEALARRFPRFLYLRIDHWVSRQTARLPVLEHIVTPYTLFIDNNMLVSEGCLASLLATAQAEQAAVVSPLIVMQGGRVHFSAAKIERMSGGLTRRTQTTPEAPMGKHWSECQPQLLDIDYAESHIALVRSSAFKGRAAELFLEDAHNAHSLAVASYQLKYNHGERLVVDPTVRASILALGFGYDIPWLFAAYNNLWAFEQAYACHARIFGPTGNPVLKHLRWHRKHLMLLLLTILQDGRAERDTLMAASEVPDDITGYDVGLPGHALSKIKWEMVPLVKARYPQWLPHLEAWLEDIEEMITDLPTVARRLDAGRRRPLGRRLRAEFSRLRARFS